MTYEVVLDTDIVMMSLLSIAGARAFPSVVVCECRL